MNFDNKWVTSTLKDFIDSIQSDQQYFCIGSVSLLSFIKNSYQRKIKDIDIICETKNFDVVKNNLLKLDYKQYTFTDKKFPSNNELTTPLEGKKNLIPGYSSTKISSFESPKSVVIISKFFPFFSNRKYFDRAIFLRRL